MFATAVNVIKKLAARKMNSGLPSAEHIMQLISLWFGAPNKAATHKCSHLIPFRIEIAVGVKAVVARLRVSAPIIF